MHAILFSLLVAASSAPATPAKPDAWTAPYLGSWQVTLTVQLSSCPERSAVGVARAHEEWELTASGYEIHVAVREPKTEARAYEGLYAGSKQELLLDDGPRATAQLAGTPQKLEGQLVQVQHGKLKGREVTCATLYHVSAARR